VLIYLEILHIVHCFLFHVIISFTRSLGNVYEADISKPFTVFLSSPSHTSVHMYTNKNLNKLVQQLMVRIVTTYYLE